MAGTVWCAALGSGSRASGTPRIATGPVRTLDSSDSSAQMLAAARPFRVESNTCSITVWAVIRGSGRSRIPLMPARDTRGGRDPVVALADDLLAVARVLAQTVAGQGDLGTQRARVLGRLDELAGVVATVRGRLLHGRAGRGRGGGRPVWPRSRRPGRRCRGPASGAARQEVRQAEALAALPAVADAVGAHGVMPVGHLDVVARVAGRGVAGGERRCSLHRRVRPTWSGLACEQDAADVLADAGPLGRRRRTRPRTRATTRPSGARGSCTCPTRRTGRTSADVWTG